MQFDQTWALFLDRDGVINRRLVDDYVKSWSTFEFEKEVPQAIATLSSIFGRIFVVTNQQGIAKGLMTEKDLQLIHQQMVVEIERAGGRVDGVYFCPHWAKDHCDCRKPRTGMALQAKQNFPEINFSKSLMVGDSPSDMEMGHQLGMKTVFIGTENAPPHTHWQYLNLKAFVATLVA